MYIIGFINLNSPRVLINPVSCTTVEELYNRLWTFLNPEDFKLSPLLTKEGLESALGTGLPVRVNFAGYSVALLLGSDNVIHEATDKFVHADLPIK